MSYNEIINSGQLEMYALGLVQDNERLFVEEQMAKHPELRKEYEIILETLEQYGKIMSENPPENVLIKAKMEIEKLKQEMADQPKSNSDPKARVVALSNRHRWWAIAASVLLIISLTMNIKLLNDNSISEAKYKALQMENTSLASHTNVLEQSVNQLSETVDAMAASDVEKTYMKGTELYDSFEGTVFWSRPTSRVLLITPPELPIPRSGEQYQLWAIVDGTPVDAGVFTPTDSAMTMKSISGTVAAFAVTIEPKGGSEAPTLEKLCMIGNVRASG